MVSNTITKKDLKKIVRESMRDVLSTELMKLRFLAMPSVSQKEQREIEKSLRQANRSTARKLRISL